MEVDYIPGGYTCVLQPADVGCNAPLKHHIRQKYLDWCFEHYRDLKNGDKFPTPVNSDIMAWVEYAYSMISEESIRKTFWSIGYRHPEDEDAAVTNELQNFAFAEHGNANDNFSTNTNQETVQIHGVNLLPPVRDVTIHENGQVSF